MVVWCVFLVVWVGSGLVLVLADSCGFVGLV